MNYCMGRRHYVTLGSKKCFRIFVRTETKSYARMFGRLWARWQVVRCSARAGHSICIWMSESATAQNVSNDRGWLVIKNIRVRRSYVTYAEMEECHFSYMWSWRWCLPEHRSGLESTQFMVCAFSSRMFLQKPNQGSAQWWLMRWMYCLKKNATDADRNEDDKSSLWPI